MKYRSLLTVLVSPLSTEFTSLMPGQSSTRGPLGRGRCRIGWSLPGARLASFSQVLRLLTCMPEKGTTQTHKPGDEP